jgi:glycopeptide antibiotics resistance protein
VFILISLRNKNFLIPIGYMLLILISSSVPMDKEIKGIEFVMKIDPGLQNFLHIPIFALLSYFWLRSFYHLRYSVKWGLFLSFLFTMVFGILDEFYQILIPGRYCSIGDILFNCTGLIIGGLIGAFLLYGRKNRRIAQW